ncbi:phosphomannomutase/phosphoglucomutase [Brevibacterium samyangense]|uniref:Phosphomannomutase/phosphoglucomutase n=1 Tax=Brevibacterium samyangense TaxID=366888 RepID=A0ABP5EZ73_9MICO
MAAGPTGPTSTAASGRSARLGRALGSYDLRGRIGTDLDADLLFALGWGAARAFLSAGPAARDALVIGHDMRPDSPLFARLLAAGARSAGATPVLLGHVSTDQLYFASGDRDLPGLMVTASHNPADWNGVKICGPGAAGLSRADGLGDPATATAEAPRPPADHLASRAAAERVDEPAARAVATGFARRIRALTALDALPPDTPIHVVADAGNGMAGKILPEVFGTAAGLDAVPIDLTGLYLELDGSFPHHEANPLVPANLEDARRAVTEHGADLGLVFDGDADRCFVIDETGAATSASAIGALVARREIARARENGEEVPVVLHNLITSRAVPEVVAAAGGRPVRTPVGHSRIKQLMRSEHAVFACEHSAHFYFRDFFGADSGILAASHVISALAQARRSDPRATVSSLLADLSPYAASGELNSSVPDTSAVLARFEAAARAGEFGDGVVDTLDGVMLTGPDSWVNVRASNTEPLVRVNVESPDRERTDALASRVLQLVRDAG